MNNDANIADLLRQLRDDTTGLVREEILLAKTEMTEKLSVAGRNAAYLAAGALIGTAALLLLLMSLSYLMAQILIQQGTEPGLAGFLGFLIVAVVVGVISAILVSKAMKTFGHQSMKPDRTVRSLREDKRWAQSKMS